MMDSRLFFLSTYKWDMIEDPDGTRKYTTKVGDGKIIEVANIRNKEHVNVLCLPTHYQCSLGCKFCHLTKLGCETMEPIHWADMVPRLIDLIKFVDRDLKPHILLSFMGVGEPTLNIGMITTVYRKISTWFRDKHYFQVAISTMAPSATILQNALADIMHNNVPAKVHFSLHATDDVTRHEIIPGSKSSISDILGVVGAWGAVDIPNGTEFHKSNDSAEIHYTLIEGVNDDLNDLLALREICIHYDLPVKFIVFNETDDLTAVGDTMIHRWCEKLRMYRIKATIYSPPGKAIGSSCGAFDISKYRQESD